MLSRDHEVRSESYFTFSSQILLLTKVYKAVERTFADGVVIHKAVEDKRMTCIAGKSGNRGGAGGAFDGGS